jgi:hypothetical protein
MKKELTVSLRRVKMAYPYPMAIEKEEDIKKIVPAIIEDMEIPLKV